MKVGEERLGERHGVLRRGFKGELTRVHVAPRLEFMRRVDLRNSVLDEYLRDITSLSSRSMLSSKGKVFLAYFLKSYIFACESIIMYALACV